MYIFRLAICKHIVSLSGGECGVSSKLNEGSTFWCEITFPVLKPSSSSDPCSNLSQFTSPVLNFSQSSTLKLRSEQRQQQREHEYLLGQQAFQVAQQHEMQQLQQQKQQQYQIQQEMQQQQQQQEMQKIILPDQKFVPNDKANLLDTPDTIGEKSSDSIPFASSSLTMANPFAIPETNSIPSSSRSLNILVADDCKMTRKMMQRMLQQMGHKIWLAEDGKEACGILLKRNGTKSGLGFADVIESSFSSSKLIIGDMDSNPLPPTTTGTTTLSSISPTITIETSTIPLPSQSQSPQPISPITTSSSMNAQSNRSGSMNEEENIPLEDLSSTNILAGNNPSNSNTLELKSMQNIHHNMNKMNGNESLTLTNGDYEHNAISGLKMNGDSIERTIDRLPPFDVVLMDNQMPKMTGVAATAFVRSHGILVPIIGVTGNALVSEKKGGFFCFF